MKASNGSRPNDLSTSKRAHSASVAEAAGDAQGGAAVFGQVLAGPEPKAQRLQGCGKRFGA